jgi:tRNA(Ile)-lysidine synthase
MHLESHMLQAMHQCGLDGQCIVVGVSGGKDSMALLHLLQNLPLRLIVAHVNYGLRGAESDAETEFLARYCDQHQLPLEIYRPDASNKDAGIQEWARKERYHFFASLKVKHHAKAIAVAHHLQDQAETVFFQFMRGGGLKSVIGMAPFEHGIWRPLLTCPLEQLRAYITKEKIAYCEDSSNASTAYSRNLIRHDLADRLEQLFPNWVQRITQRAAMLQELNIELILQLDEEEAEWLQIDQGQIKLDINQWETMSMRHYRLWHFLDKLGLSGGIHHQVEQMMQSVVGSKSECGGWDIWRERKGLVFENSRKPLASAMVIPDAAAMPDQYRDWKIRRTTYAAIAHLLDGKERLALRCGALQFPVTIRPAQTGDRMQPFGMKGHKLISKIFIAQKIERKDKEQYPVWCHDQEIYWLESLAVAEQCRAQGEEEVYFFEKRRMPETL